jgi:hypothetical protein
MVSRLTAAESSLSRENDEAARNQLRSLILQVQAHYRSGRIDADTANELIDGVQALIDAI